MRTAPLPENFIDLANRFSMNPEELATRVLFTFGKKTHRELIVQRMPREVERLFTSKPSRKQKRN